MDESCTLLRFQRDEAAVLEVAHLKMILQPKHPSTQLHLNIFAFQSPDSVGVDLATWKIFHFLPTP